MELAFEELRIKNYVKIYTRSKPRTSSVVVEPPFGLEGKFGDLTICDQAIGSAYKETTYSKRSQVAFRSERAGDAV